MKKWPELQLIVFTLIYGCSVIGVVYSAHLPRISLCILGMAISLLLHYRFSPLRAWLMPCILLCAGLAWVSYSAKQILQFQVPPALINQQVRIEGTVVDLPQVDSLYTRFDLRVRCWQNQVVDAHFKLNWYGKYPLLQVGDVWQMTVKVKPPHGLENPGTLDHQRALFFEGIQATGYVVNRQPAILLAQHPWRYAINYLRQRIATTIIQSVPNSDLAAFLEALTTGSRAHMKATQWAVFANTGTSYLIVIAGLHISVIASAMYFFVMFCWRRLPRLMLYFSAQQAGMVGALIGAWFYGLLSGMTLPTQRALIMITILIVTQLKCYWVPMSRRWLWAFIGVIICQPFALLTASFWLSFVAVAWISYLLCARLRSWRSRWLRWVWLQVAIFFGLLPLTLYYFQQIPLVTMLASSVTLPWIEFLIVPLCVATAGIDLICSMLSHYLFALLAYLLMPAWWFLQHLSNGSSMIWHQSLHPIGLLLVSQLAITLLFAPRGWPWRSLGFIGLLPLFYPRIESPAVGEVWLTLLDVGQGLSVLIETAHHRLLYDAGPRLDHFDAGLQVILPYLQYRHIATLDELIVSHGDNDHIGGAPALLAQLPIHQVLTSVQSSFSTRKIAAMSCQQGQTWVWDQVQWQILSPPQEAYLGNNSSCVLRITLPDHRAILLTGDIEKKREKWLLAQYPHQLKATVLIAPHHGSRSSSSAAFVEAVQPRYVLFPVGYYNRYKFPAASVVARYQAQHALCWDTATAGAITVKLFNNQKIMVNAYHQPHYFWQVP